MCCSSENLGLYLFIILNEAEYPQRAVLYFVFLLRKYPYLILTNAYVLAGANMDDQTRIFIKEIFLFGSSANYNKFVEIDKCKMTRFFTI